MDVPVNANNRIYYFNETDLYKEFERGLLSLEFKSSLASNNAAKIVLNDDVLFYKKLKNDFEIIYCSYILMNFFSEKGFECFIDGVIEYITRNPEAVFSSEEEVNDAKDYLEQVRSNFSLSEERRHFSSKMFEILDLLEDRLLSYIILHPEMSIKDSLEERTNAPIKSLNDNIHEITFSIKMPKEVTSSSYTQKVLI